MTTRATKASIEWRITLVLMAAIAVWLIRSHALPREEIQLNQSISQQTAVQLSHEPPDADGVESRQVLAGIDVFLSQRQDLLRGKRCGLITNTSAVTRDGVLTMDALFADETINLTALFAPEHGLREEYQTSRVGDGFDSEKKVPIYSLYGESLKPTKEQLRRIDMLIFDIQDVGVRFFTYISTLCLAMEAAAASNVEFVVLDRPNPLGGLVVEGPVLANEFRSFVGCHPIPTRHGMTIGELALLFNDRFLPTPVKLHVVQMSSWTRDMWFDDTELPWRKPSPGIYTLDTAIAYGATCFFEGTNLSEGRGTDTPFQIVGAPWGNGELLAESLNSLALPGVEFEPTEFTPKGSKHKGRKCKGVSLRVTDRDKYRCVLTGVAMLYAIHQLWPSKFRWTGGNFIDLLAGTDELRKLVNAGAEPREIIARRQAATDEFQRIRRRYLLYGVEDSS